MKEFVLIFRMDITTVEAQPTPEQMRVYMQQWVSWLDGIADQKQLADGGNHFSKEGAVLHPQNARSDGPYTVNRESAAGYVIVLAENFEGAVRLAQKCPILQGSGTSVEVREVASPG
jgi:hypothetical protein